MQEIRLSAQIRDSRGTRRGLSALRKDRKIPAVIYGGAKPSVSVVVGEAELLKATKAGGANAILHLKHEKGEDTVILKALQHHVVTHQPIHADFQRISLKQKIEVRVPLHVVGESPGVKNHGGVLEHILREFRVRALPTAIPQRIDVDVSRLELNQGLLVKDISAPAGAEILEAPDHLVVNVIQPKEEVAPAPEAAAAAAEPGKAQAAAKGTPAAPKPGAPAAAPAGEKKKEGK